MTQYCDRQSKCTSGLESFVLYSSAYRMCVPVPYSNSALNMSHWLGMNCIRNIHKVCVHTQNMGASYPTVCTAGVPSPRTLQQWFLSARFGGWFNCVFQVLGESVAFILTAGRGWGRIVGLVLTLLLPRWDYLPSPHAPLPSFSRNRLPRFWEIWLVGNN